MPVYEYECAACGPFTAFRSMADYAKPCPCEACGTEAPRAFLTAPAFASMDATKRKSIAVNERAAHAPRRSQGHGPGCGCCAPKPASRAPAAAKTFPGARPWMISH
jgi:putative FmdB family regulatory protein